MDAAVEFGEQVQSFSQIFAYLRFIGNRIGENGPYVGYERAAGNTGETIRSESVDGVVRLTVRSCEFLAESFHLRKVSIGWRERQRG